MKNIIKSRLAKVGLQGGRNFLTAAYSDIREDQKISSNAARRPLLTGLKLKKFRNMPYPAKQRTLWSFLRAESLVEVIIAIFVVGLGAAVATSLIVTALQSNNFSRDSLIALNLAEEGLEAVRSVRDTNWLKYGFDKESCWNLLPGKTCVANPPATDRISGNYAVELDNNYIWQLHPKTQILDLENATPLLNDAYKLKVVNRDGAFFYTPNENSTYSEVTANPQTGRFYRMVQVNNSTDPGSMDVKSTVQWIAQGKAHTIFLDTKLTNYQKVKR
jgi:type II secretory pathway pseudopilin PulG